MESIGCSTRGRRRSRCWYARRRPRPVRDRERPCREGAADSWPAVGVERPAGAGPGPLRAHCRETVEAPAELEGDRTDAPALLAQVGDQRSARLRQVARTDRLDRQPAQRLDEPGHVPVAIDSVAAGPARCGRTRDADCPSGRRDRPPANSSRREPLPLGRADAGYSPFLTQPGEDQATPASRTRCDVGWNPPRR